MSTTHCRRRALAGRLAIPMALCGALLASSCALNERPVDAGADSGVRGTLNGMGASSMSVAQENWIAQFQTVHSRSTVIYAPEGSGAGRDAFMGGGTDFAGSDRAFSMTENVVGAFAACAADSAALDLPVYISPIAIVFNVDGVSELNLTPEVLAGIFAGDISTWSDERIATLNPEAELPDLQVSAVHRSDDSGTTGNFTAYLSAAATDVWKSEPSGRGHSRAVRPPRAPPAWSPPCGAASEPSATSTHPRQVSWPPRASAATGRSSRPPRRPPHWPWRPHPSRRAGAEHDLAIQLDAEAPGYPIVLVSYVLACERYDDVEKAGLVRTYLGYVASEAGQSAAASGAGAAPLSESLRALVLTAVESIR